MRPVTHWTIPGSDSTYDRAARRVGSSSPEMNLAPHRRISGAGHVDGLSVLCIALPLDALDDHLRDVRRIERL